MVTSTFFPHAGIPSDRKVNVTSQISSPKSWYTTNCSGHRVSITCCCMHSLYISFTCVICIQNKYDFSRLLEEGVEKKSKSKRSIPKLHFIQLEAVENASKCNGAKADGLYSPFYVLFLQSKLFHEHYHG